MRWSPRSPYCTSLHLDLTNCSPSHNTLSAFNYCLEVSGLRVTHSTGSLCGSVGAACVRVSIECAECPLYDDWGIEGSAEFHCAFSFFSTNPPPALAHHVLHTLDPPLHRPRFRSANGFARSLRESTTSVPEL